MKLFLFAEPYCEGVGHLVDVKYGQDILYLSPYDPAKPFQSFNISRALQANEQIDLSRVGRDASQSQTGVVVNT